MADMAEQTTEQPNDGEILRYRPRGRVVPAKEIEAWETGRDFVEAAKREAERLRTEAVAAYEEAKRQGFEEGRKEGAESAARLLSETAARADRYLAEADGEIVDLALGVVRQVLGDFDVGQLTRNAVRHGLSKQRQGQHLTLYVAPDMVEAIRDNLDEHIASGVRHLLTVEPDARLKRGDCRLASEFGFVDLGIEAQLRAIHLGLRDGLNRHAEGDG